MAAKDEICNQFCSEHPTVRQQETTIAKYPFAKTKTNELSLLHDEYHNPNEEEKAYHGNVDPCGSYRFTESRFKDAKTMMGQQVNMAMSTSNYNINGIDLSKAIIFAIPFTDLIYDFTSGHVIS